MSDVDAMPLIPGPEDMQRWVRLFGPEVGWDMVLEAKDVHDRWVGDDPDRIARSIEHMASMIGAMVEDLPSVRRGRPDVAAAEEFATGVICEVINGGMPGEA